MVILQPPTPIAPAADSFQPRRPTFVVGDAARTGTSGPVSYRFEVSVDSQFAVLVDAGTVSEAPGQTIFTAMSDLPSGQTLYWRARTVGPDAATTSEWARPVPFFIGLADGKYRYWMTLFLPDSCSNDPYIAYWFPIVFDDGLTVAADRLLYTPAVRGQVYQTSFQLQLTRTADRVSGTIGGNVVHPLGQGIFAPIVFVGPRAATEYMPFDTGVFSTAGSTSDGQSFEGTFDGVVYLANNVNINTRCFSRAIRWTLSPNRP